MKNDEGKNASPMTNINHSSQMPPTNSAYIDAKTPVAPQNTKSAICYAAPQNTSPEDSRASHVQMNHAPYPQTPSHNGTVANNHPAVTPNNQNSRQIGSLYFH